MNGTNDVPAVDTGDQEIVIILAKSVKAVCKVASCRDFFEVPIIVYLEIVCKYRLVLKCSGQTRWRMMCHPITVVPQTSYTGDIVQHLWIFWILKKVQIRELKRFCRDGRPQKRENPSHLASLQILYFYQTDGLGDCFISVDQVSLQSKNSGDFADFVNQMLSHRDGSAIINFEVNNNDCMYPVSVPDLNAWEMCAVDHNVPNLCIHGVSTKDAAELSGGLFTCISLTSLTLENFVLDLPRTVGFPLLKTLKLDHVTIPSENLINKLFSNCPVLENLAVRRSNFITFNYREPLNIFVPNLKHLSLLFMHSYKKTDISAPNLKQFACLGLPPDISLETLLSLCQYLLGHHNVTELSSYDFYIEALTSRDPVCLPTYSTLKHLHLHMLPIENQVQAVIVLLKRTPNLQTLGIYVVMRDTMQDTLVEKEYWQPQELFSVHTLNHL
ncbi:hypothetical protein IFM89_030381 [Coptis chinensis]|uniref:F-box/LRR-repeat protein 15/At3g58940/PEG3-like LRR domain-containing protein n=1 Tax=Coptis chinensis TaxID=261450 RepID=A0A835GZ18_9MAGN|nr:hypothetical protein IFM89_030381 [Coptis chinensis]